ncbi:ankyrin repeat domain-containing protein [Actinokineospora iranica]|uniref:Uncharacterized protein n=1 Tax=Actinokineospora iranica TaxID=1271860 RepID=A0A1G6J447_9PSEU|nr:ankyrin repeat domain-containing protein [Actinokineospora iranica]SDC13510.1 hypothetical protein SAMN05216174_101228 [Actinokineospora iranica]
MASSEWDGATLRASYGDDYRERRDGFASAAYDGDWKTVLEELAKSPTLINAWRPGGASWYTPVHQAAWHGADPEIIRTLVSHNPWLTLRTASGDRPLDIALRGGHAHLGGLLMPVIRNPVPTDVLAALQKHFHDLVRERAASLVDKHQLRLPELDPLTELADGRMSFPVPGMYGGFYYVLQGLELEVKSWSRVVGGSGQTHRITVDGYWMTESGYV